MTIDATDNFVSTQEPPYSVCSRSNAVRKLVVGSPSDTEFRVLLSVCFVCFFSCLAPFSSTMIDHKDEARSLFAESSRYKWYCTIKCTYTTVCLRLSCAKERKYTRIVSVPSLYHHCYHSKIRILI